MTNIQFNFLMPKSIMVQMLASVRFVKKLLHLLEVKGSDSTQTKKNVSISKFIADMHVEI